MSEREGQGIERAHPSHYTQTRVRREGMHPHGATHQSGAVCLEHQIAAFGRHRRQVGRLRARVCMMRMIVHEKDKESRLEEKGSAANLRDSIPELDIVGESTGGRPGLSASCMRCTCVWTREENNRSCTVFCITFCGRRREQVLAMFPIRPR